MKKIALLILVLFLSLTLMSCNLSFEFPGEVYAPSITQEEADFIGMVKELKKSTVAILNNSVEPARYGSGIIVDNPDEANNSVYYVITTQYNVQNADTVTVYLSRLETVIGTVVGRRETYDFDEDIVLIKITSFMELEPIELIETPDLETINMKSIFSIGTTINTAYFNYLTNPAQIMGIQDNIIVHGTNLNSGQLGSPLFLKENGRLVGINIAISDVVHERPEVLINRALSINSVIEIVEEIWSLL